MPVPTANYTGTHSWPSQAIDNYEMGQHGTLTPATNPEFRRIGGMVSTSTGTFADLVDAILRFDKRGWQTPHLDAFSLFSTTTAGSVTTLAAGSITDIGGLRQISVLLDVTSTVGVTATLTAYLDSRFDGTAWINVAAYALMTTAAKNIIILSKQHGTALEVTGVDARVNAGTVRNIGFGNDLRLVYSVAGATSQFTFSVFFNGIG